MNSWGDATVEDYYRDRYESIYGYDPLDPEWTEDDIEIEEEEE